MPETLQKSTLEEKASLPQDADPSLRRALEVELALDPEHTLPEVTLVPDPSKLVPKRGQRLIERDMITHNGEVIGECGIDGITSDIFTVLLFMNHIEVRVLDLPHTGSY